MSKSRSYQIVLFFAILFTQWESSKGTVVERCFSAENATEDESCSSISIPLDGINVTDQSIGHFVNPEPGPHSPGEFKTLLEANAESTEVVLSLYFNLFKKTVSTMTSSTSIPEIVRQSIVTRPELANELTRASLLGSPSPIIAKNIAHGLYKSFVDQGSSFTENQFTGALGVLLEFAATQVPSDSWKPATFIKLLSSQADIQADVISVAGRKDISQFQTALIKVVQARAQEVKVQAVGRELGGTVTVSSAASIDIPPRAIINSDEQVTVHVYNCDEVRVASSDVSSTPAQNKCIAITPHKFDKPITVGFQAAPDASRCMKIPDEISVDWQDFNCQISDTGWVTYTTTELSVLTAERRLGQVYDPHPDRMVLFAEAPPQVDAGHRFTRHTGTKRAGKFQEFLQPLNKEKRFARDFALDTSLLGFDLDSVSGLLFWSDGMRVFSSHWRQRLDGVPAEPVVRVPGAIRLHIRGANFGSSLPRVRTVTVSLGTREKYLCEPTMLVSSQEMYCEIPLTRDATLLRKARKEITRDTVGVRLINQHQLERHEAPLVSSVEVNVRGRSPRSLRFDDKSRWLYWVDAGLGRIVRVQVPLDVGDTRDRFDPPSTVVQGLDGAVVPALATCRSGHGATLAWFQGDQLLVAENVPDSALDQSIQPRLALDALDSPQGLAVVEPSDCSSSSKIVFTESAGRVWQAKLDGSPLAVDTGRPRRSTRANRRLIKTLHSRARLTGVAVSTTAVYWAESGTNRIMTASLTGADVHEVIGPYDKIQDSTGGSHIAWPKDIIVRGDELYWSGYLGTISKANLDGTEAKALLEQDYSVSSKMVLNEVEALQTRGVEFSLQGVE